MLLIVKYVFITPWCPANKLKWHKVIILSAHVFGIANTAVSMSRVDIILNSNEPNNIYFYAKASTFLIADLVAG